MNKFKRILSAALATVMIAIPTLPSFAETKSDYISDITKVYKNPVVESTSVVSLDFNSAMVDGIKGNFNATINTQANTQTGDVYIEAYMRNAKYKNKQMQMPPIKLYAKYGTVYMSKDIFNYGLERLGVNKNQIDLKKPYVKINPALLHEKDIIKNVSKMPIISYANMELSLRKLVKSMYLGDYFKAKIDDSIYTVNLKSDEITELADAYIKWALRNPDVIRTYFKEIGLSDVVKDIKQPTQQEMQNQLNKYLEKTNDNLKSFKSMLKGSSLYYRAELQDDKKPEEKLNLKLRIDLGQGKDPSKMYSVNLKIDTKYQGKKEAKVQEPKDFYVLNKQAIDIIEKAPTKVKINPSTKIAEIKTLSTPKTEKLNAVMDKGEFKVEKKQLEQMFNIKIHNRYDYVPIRDITISGYTVDWDAKTKQITVYPTVK